MTIDPKRIERLWEACPELRPARLDGKFVLAYAYTDYADCPWGWMRVHDSYIDEADEVDQSTAHALIRDKIVWYLNQTVDGRNRIMLSLNDAQLGYDPTEACILAAERVLGLPEWKE